MKRIALSELRKRGMLIPMLTFFLFCAMTFPAEAQAILWNEDWEDGNWSDWTVTAGTWEVGVPTGSRCRSGPGGR